MKNKPMLSLEKINEYLKSKDKKKFITLKNIHGEEIYIRLIRGKVMVRHTDCTDKFVPLADMLTDYILLPEEVSSIRASAIVVKNEKYLKVKQPL